MTINSVINDRQRYVFPNSVYWDGSKYVENKDIVINSNFYDYMNLFSTIQTNYYYSGAFWKVREILIRYNLPIQKWSKTKNPIINKASVSLFGRNLFTFLPKTNIWGDPELTEGQFASKFYGMNLSITF